MNKKATERYFFITYNNGDTFYFKINYNGEIYCNEFKKVYEQTKKEKMPAAYAINFTDKTFSMIDNNGNVIYSLEDYRHITNINKEQEEATIDRLYIDEDIIPMMLEYGKLRYTEEASKILGLLDELETESKIPTRKRTK